MAQYAISVQLGRVPILQVTGDCILLAEKKYSLYIAIRLCRYLCGGWLNGSNGSTDLTGLRSQSGVKVERSKGSKWSKGFIWVYNGL